MPSVQATQTQDNAIYTTSNGAPVKEPHASQRAGFNGPLLLQDFHLIDHLAHFDRERIPERVVHAKGAGARGYFELTDSLSDITSARVFQKEGTRAPVIVRFSTVGGESGSADSARDPRGFSIKIKTEEGNLDWVFNNTPVFFLRDPAKFPTFIHTQKRDPQTHLKDADAFWDYLSQNPESIHQVMILFSDRGTPDGYHNMHGYSGHTFKYVKEDGSYVYTQIHLKADNGFKVLDNKAAGELAGSNPDHAIQSLFENIENGQHPSWTAYIQTMTPEQAEKFRYNVLDLTKVWPQKDFPLRKFGKLVLNENPKNYFAEIEQSAFAPSHLVPGIEPSADPVLQARLFSYPDTQRHRLGVNYQQLPVNRPIVPPANFHRDGPANFDNQGFRPNYPSTISPLQYKPRPYEAKLLKHEQWLGYANLDLSEVTELDFEQPRALWQSVFTDVDREHFVTNVSVHIKNVRNKAILERQLRVFAAVDQGLSDRIAKAVGHPTVEPLEVKLASEAVRFKVNEL